MNKIGKVLLDTDIIINILKDHKKTVDILQSSINDHSFYISPIVWMETYKGIRKGEEKKILKLLNFFECLNINNETGLIAGNLLNKFSKSHGLEEIDAFVAAIAQHNKCQLFTYNKKHFRMLDVDLFT